MSSGSFKPLPKKGTTAHEHLKIAQAKFISRWQQSGNIPCEFKPKKTTVRNLGEVEILGEFIPAGETERALVVRRVGFKDTFIAPINLPEKPS